MHKNKKYQSIEEQQDEMQDALKAFKQLFFEEFLLCKMARVFIEWLNPYCEKCDKYLEIMKNKIKSGRN